MRQKPLKGNDILQGKPCTGQGRAGMRRRRPLPINQAITQTSEISKKFPDVSKIELRITNQAHSIAPAQSTTNSNEKTHRSPMINDIPFYPDPTYRPPPKPVRSPTPGSSQSSDSTNIDSKINIDFEENSPFQEGIIFLPKQTNIDQIVKVIQRKVLKCMHLSVTIKDIQA